MLKHIKVFYKILIVFTVNVLIFLAVIAVGVQISQGIFQNELDFYEHPYSIIKAINTVKSNILRIENILNDMYDLDDSAKIIEQYNIMTQHENSIFDSLYIMEKSFTGDLNKVTDLRTKFTMLRELNHRIADELLIGNQENARATHKELAFLYDDVLMQIEELQLIAEYTAATSIKDSQQKYSTLRNLLIWTGVFAIITVIILAYFLSTSLNRPIRRLIEEIDKTRDTDYEVSLDIERRDEFGKVAKAFYDMVQSIRRSHQERMQIEKNRRNQHKLEAIGILASGVAHEINNPVTGILGYSQLILEDPECNDTTHEYAAEIINESNRVSKIVKNLLNFSRQMPDTFDYADIRNIIHNAVNLIRVLIKKDGIELTLQIEPNLPLIYCIESQIQQVILNMLTNAWNAVNQRGHSSSTDSHIAITAAQEHLKGQDYLHITVEDNGTGIPPDVADRIFDPFFTTKSRDKGTGLGMSISYGIIKDHDGDIYFDTQVNNFTRFHIRLPFSSMIQENSHDE